jgi:hypothetical protein
MNPSPMSCLFRVNCLNEVGNDKCKSYWTVLNALASFTHDLVLGTIMQWNVSFLF